MPTDTPQPLDPPDKEKENENEKKIEKKPRGRLVRKFPGKTYFFLSARVHPGESYDIWY
jgi:hypothetical protein